MNLRRSFQFALIAAVAVELVPFLLLLSSEGGPCGPVDARSGFAVLWHLPSLVVVSFVGLDGVLGGTVVAVLQIALLAFVLLPLGLMAVHRGSGPAGSPH